MNNIHQLTIREIVSNDYRAALVFRTFGIDFCCKGEQTIQEACAKKKTDPQLLLEKLIEGLTTPADENFDFKSWPLSLLANYIENKHHAMIKDRIPLILKFLKRVVKVHSAHNPDLKTIHNLFASSAEELQRHLEQEELLIFPFIRKISSDSKRRKLLFSESFAQVRRSIHRLMIEHEHENDYLEELRNLTQNYTPPDYACNTYKVAFALLQEFDVSMQKHMHLERNILFPEALALEFDSTLN
jgi:regulator of cell morphogenesis and NO signaling